MSDHKKKEATKVKSLGEIVNNFKEDVSSDWFIDFLNRLANGGISEKKIARSAFQLFFVLPVAGLIFVTMFVAFGYLVMDGIGLMRQDFSILAAMDWKSAQALEKAAVSQGWLRLSIYPFVLVAQVSLLRLVLRKDIYGLALFDVFSVWEKK